MSDLMEVDRKAVFDSRLESWLALDMMKCERNISKMPKVEAQPILPYTYAAMLHTVHMYVHMYALALVVAYSGMVAIPCLSSFVQTLHTHTHPQTDTHMQTETLISHYLPPPCR